MNGVGYLGYISHEKTTIESRDIELAEKYWLYDFEKKEYVYTMQMLSEEFCVGVYNIGPIIRKFSPIALNLDSCICISCRRHRLAGSRTALDKILKAEEEYECEQCLENKEKKRIEKLTEEANQYRLRYLQGDYDINHISHIEKLYLYMQLRESGDDSIKYFTVQYDDAKTGSINEDLNIVWSLINKGIVCDVHDYKGNKAALELLGIRANEFEEDVFIIRLSERKIDMINIENAIYTRLLADSVKIGELEEIGRVIEEIRVSDIYMLLRHIRDEFEIPIQFGIGLENVIKKIAIKYSLSQCLNLFRRTAKEVAAFLYKTYVNPFAKMRLFQSFLKKYIYAAESYGWKIYSSYTLPYSVSNTEFESLVCSLYFDCITWSDLSIEKIKKKWISKLTIID